MKILRHSKTLRLAVPALIALTTGTLAGQEAARPRPQSQEEHRVIVWRTEENDSVDLPTLRGRGGFLGVGLLDLTPELRRHFGVPEDRGVMVSRIVADSPAARADLQPADIVTTIDGEALDSSVELSMRVATASEEAEIAVERWRDGRKVVLRIPLEVRLRSQLDISPLLVRRVALEPGHRVEIERDGEGGEGPVKLDHRWVTQVVERVGDSFANDPFVGQLEALRRERNDLLEKLREMEKRLEALEGELHLLHEERPE